MNLTTQRSLEEIESEVKVAVEHLRVYVRRTLLETHFLGQLLIEAKRRVEHGEWLDWLAEMQISPRMAQRCMQLALAYEYDNLSHFKTVDQALKQLASPDKRPGIADYTGHPEWHSPAHVIEAARQCMGGIDLDPASRADANETVQATRFFTAEDDGLLQSWSGRLWLNPPYSKMAAFMGKLLEVYHAGRVEQAIILANNQTDAKWAANVMDAANVLCFTRGRLIFTKDGVDAGGKPLQGQMLVGLGVDPRKFEAAFRGIGHVVPSMADRSIASGLPGLAVEVDGVRLVLRR